jgi:ElaB/YqjD/DUF883 family membrane-anchored ribosome-binding protein
MGQEPTTVTTAGQPAATVPPSTTGGPTTVTTPQTDDPAAIRRDIATTRDEMEGTLEAINDRVNPQRVYRRRTGRIRQRWYSLRESVMGSSDYSVRDRMSDVSVRDRMPDVSERAEQARQAVSDAPERIEQRTRGNPLAAGMIAFGVGALIGSALPESDAERRVAREATDKVDVEGTKQRLSEHARDLKETVQDHAREAAEDVKDSAREAAHDVQDQARHEGERVRTDARQSGEQVRREM